VLPCLVVFYLAPKPSDVGADVDGLPCSLHRPMTYNSQGWTMPPDRCYHVPSFSSGQWPLSGGAKPPSLDI
jgi:hypothetical protein